MGRLDLIRPIVTNHELCDPFVPSESLNVFEASVSITQ